MAYTGTHLLLTWQWTAPDGETGQTGLRTTQAFLPTEAEMDAIESASRAWWGGLSCGAAFTLTTIKAAVIEASGHYPPDAGPLVRDLSPPQAGSGLDTGYPLQVSAVSSLLTAAPRGRAHRGRMYLPPIGDSLAPNRQWTPLQAANRRDAVIGLIEDLNAVAGTVSVMSKLGTGTTRAVTAVAQGTRPDVQRRRAKQQTEAYVEAPVT